MAKLRSFFTNCVMAALWGATYGVSAEDFFVQVWDTDAGLPDSTVISIAQTPDGYLWAGTKNGGLARFDGQRFMNFNQGNTPELRSTQIQKLVVDNQGTLWVGTPAGGLISYRNGRFHFEQQGPGSPQGWLQSAISATSNSVLLAAIGRLFEGTATNGTNHWATWPEPSDARVTLICGDRQGTIWYRTRDGQLGQVQHGQFMLMPNPPGLGGQIVNTLLTDNAGRLWVGTGQELARWDGTQFINQTPTNGELKINVAQLAACADGSLWVRTDKVLRKWREQQWVAQVDAWGGDAPQTSHFPLLLQGDSRGGLWVSHYEDGLWHVAANGSVTRVQETPQGLPNTQFRCWFEDREGNLWLGLNGGGLICVRERTFHQIRPVAALRPRVVNSICEDMAGMMWFSTSGNSLLRWRNGEFNNFTLPVQRERGYDAPIFSTAAGCLWAGTLDNGMVRLENEKFSLPFPSELIHGVHVLYQDRAGKLWIGAMNGLFCLADGTLKSFTAENEFPPNDVRAITEDPAGGLWLATAVGDLWCRRDGKFKVYSPKDIPLIRTPVMADTDFSPNQTLEGYSGGERFVAAYADNRGVIWIGSLGGGLLRFENGQFTRYTPREGLPSDQVSQILEDERGRLWLGTPAGIAMASKQELNRFAFSRTNTVRFITYGKLDGMPTAECSRVCQPACWRSRDGRLWFATVKGAVWMDPAEMRFNPVSPPVVMEEVAVDGKVVGEDGQPAKFFTDRPPTRLSLGPGRHYLDFKFTSPSLAAPDRVRFRWRLGGLEKDWTRESDRRSVSYSFLPPGSYEFQVQACNGDGMWNATVATIPLTVQPYFWQTWWFRIPVPIILFLTLGALVLRGIRRRQRLQIERLQQLRALERERVRIAQDLHDDLGANLTEISLLGDLAQRSNITMERTRQHVSDMTAKSRESVMALDEIVWAVNPRHDSTSSLKNYFCQYARHLLELTPINCRLEVANNLPELILNSEQRHSLFLAFKEALANVIHHAAASEAWITISIQEGFLCVEVADNGKGMDPHFPDSSADGLKNMRHRLEKIGGRCEIQSRRDGGTKVRFRLPVANLLAAHNHPIGG